MMHVMLMYYFVIESTEHVIACVNPSSEMYTQTHTYSKSLSLLDVMTCHCRRGHRVTLWDDEGGDVKKATE